MDLVQEEVWCWVVCEGGGIIENDYLLHENIIIEKGNFRLSRIAESSFFSTTLALFSVAPCCQKLDHENKFYFRRRTLKITYF